MDSPSRVFAAVIPSAARDFAYNEKEQGLEGLAQVVHRQSHNNRVREVQVTGVAEICSPADRVTVRISVGNTKESVNDVRNSVSRRVEYILQTLRQHGVKDEDTSVRRFLHREDDLYHMDVEVTVSFSDFEKMERVCSVLLEKLDKSVCVGVPHFYHSTECLSQLRQRACVSAVENAQQKACEVSRLLGQNLGPPLLVREEETREWRNEEEEEEGDRRRGGATHPQLPHRPTVTASCRVSVTFSLQDKTRKKL
ncbi:interleukin-1 receptor-associated kinase 1-binding protein 1 homolog [Centroberyx gerrardi]|uniref:interleukin-1 receptor-associated kinase 1-binding protein 1 homolog n=1 Tax=Centroberyx gerrardi TaxID=166262 RepID=UPI003AAB8D0A